MDAELYLSPRAGLVYAQNLREQCIPTLLVLDTIVDYLSTERKIFDLADQPFGPYNLINEIMENTGCFETGSLTSIFIYDTQQMNFNYQLYQKYSLAHIESIADQVIEFEPEFVEMKRSLPKLDFKGFSGVNQKYWMHPLINYIREEMQNFAQSVKSSLKQNKLRKELKIKEDPWENFLVHDAKAFLPILNHSVSSPS